MATEKAPSARVSVRVDDEEEADLISAYTTGQSRRLTLLKISKDSALGFTERLAAHSLSCTVVLGSDLEGDVIKEDSDPTSRGEALLALAKTLSCGQPASARLDGVTRKSKAGEKFSVYIRVEKSEHASQILDLLTAESRYAAMVRKLRNNGHGKGTHTGSNRLGGHGLTVVLRGDDAEYKEVIQNGLSPAERGAVLLDLLVKSGLIEA